jgi:predicted nuclease with RNAse H fold
VITVGVDLAAMPERTAVALVEWDGTAARLLTTQLGADDDDIVRAVSGAAKVGIDCPVGWPDAFVDLLIGYRHGQAATPAGAGGPGWRRQLVNRRTDLFVRQVAGVTPLSVAADRIAHVALRCVALFARLEAAGVTVDRAGRGVVVEVYPKASLKRWDLLPRLSYKQAGHPEAVGSVLAGLISAAPWLDLGERASAVSASHDVLDALVAALTARAAHKSLTYPPDESDRTTAETEGWIAVPCAALDELP